MFKRQTSDDVVCTIQAVYEQIFLCENAIYRFQNGSMADMQDILSSEPKEPRGILNDHVLK